MNELLFEELEKVSTFGPIGEFLDGAWPWVSGGLTLAVAVAFT